MQKLEKDTQEIDHHTRFVILLSKTSPDQMPEHLIRSHVQYLKDLDRNGQLHLCGPFKDYRGGMIIINAASYEEAEKIAQADPFVKEGEETFELRTWTLACDDNDYLGFGLSK